MHSVSYQSKNLQHFLAWLTISEYQYHNYQDFDCRESFVGPSHPDIRGNHVLFLVYDIPQINWKIIMYIHQFYSHKHNNLSFLRKFLEFHHKSNFPENSMTNVFRAVLNIIYGDVVFPEYQIDRALLIPLNDFIALQVLGICTLWSAYKSRYISRQLPMINDIFSTFLKIFGRWECYHQLFS